MKTIPDKHKVIIHDIKSGMKVKDIATKFNMNPVSISRIKSKYKDLIENDNNLQVYENYKYVEDYENRVVNNMKSASIAISNILSTKSWQNMSAPQLTTALATMIDKLRLLEGKSTSNIAQQVIHNLSDDDRKLLRGAIGKFKHAYLNKD